ncbi:MAG TPA: hypothetical protein VES00_05460 [Burkholderiaceae bacterium]|nr:hypothetical protein [Burkholderiaceae bacterium]
MSSRGPALADGDWWAPHVLIAAFVVLVAAILLAVPGWSAPLHAWIALAAFVIGVLALHAAGRAGASAWRRRWRAALLAVLLSAGLAAAAAAMLHVGRRIGPADAGDILVEPAEPARATR